MRAGPSSGLELRHHDAKTGWHQMEESLDNKSLGNAVAIGPVQGEAVAVYHVYKRRWFGLGILMLLNIVISWGVSRFS